MCHMDWEIALFLTLGSTKWEGCEKHKMTSQEQKVNTGSGQKRQGEGTQREWGTGTAGQKGELWDNNSVTVLTRCFFPSFATITITRGNN